MEANQILQSDILDILFENRNKAYGAYELRKKYDRRIVKALVVTGVIVLTVILGPILSRVLASKSNFIQQPPDVIVHQVEVEKTPPPVTPPPQRVQTPPPPATTRLVTFAVKDDKDVKKEELPPIDDVKKVDVVTREGEEIDVITPPTSVDGNKGIVQVPKTEDNSDGDGVVLNVQIQASVNLAQWRRYLENQLQRYSEDAVNAGIASGQYTVQVKFLVEKDGSITDVQALNDPGFGLAKGAVEVVKKGPRWSPGEQNGRKVRSYHTQPITFLINE